MEDKKSFKFQVAQRKAEKYYDWSHDMEAVLSGNRLWNFVECITLRQPLESSSDPVTILRDIADLTTLGRVERSESDVRKRDLSLYIVTSVNQSYKKTFWQLKSHLEA